MTNISIVTDSAASIPENIVQDLGITVLPFNINFGGKTFREGVDITKEDYYARLRQGQMPKTSQPSPGAFYEVYKKLSKDFDTIISIHIGRKISGALNSAKVAREMLKEKDIEVVDSESLTMVQGFMVMAAAAEAKAGKTKQEILQTVERLKSEVFGYIAVPTLKYLRESGRINAGKALLGSFLSIKPIFTLNNGVVDMIDKTRGFPQALSKMIDFTESRVGKVARQIAILHSDALKEAREFCKNVLSRINASDVVFADTGATITSHGGPGMVGIVAVKK